MRKKRLRGGNGEHGGEPARGVQPRAADSAGQAATPPGETAGTGERTAAADAPGTDPATGGTAPAPAAPAPRRARPPAAPAPAPAGPARRTARVRNRLVGSVAVVAVAVAAAAAPAVAAAIDRTHDSQRLVDLSRTSREAVVLAHALADERDAMTEFVAAGRSSAAGAGVSESQRARVDRQVAELRPDVSGGLRRQLDDLPRLRQQALTGRGSALEVAEKYTGTVQALLDLSGGLARKMPERADTGSAAALASLARADEQASAVRGLLLGALAADGDRRGLVAAARRADVREKAALADFEQLAPADVRERFTRTVNGTEVTTAERYLERLTDDTELSPAELMLETERVGAALTARIDRMRGVESALAAAEVERLEKLRDEDVTELEIRIALAAACLLAALGAGVWAARSMTRPLAALRLGARRVAADPVGEEPVAFRGRRDEFADVVRSVNELKEIARREHERAARLDADRTRMVGERRRLADERTELRRERDEIAARLDGLRARVHGSFVSLALRNLGLIERQLAVIEGLEEKEQDPDRLETLFQLDHLATGMRRYSENLLVIAGSENKATHPGPVPLLDVLRAAISEVERYDRVQIHSLPPHTHVAGFAADSMSHLIAELVENATTFSPPDAHVQISGWLLDSGELLLSVQDEGIGMTPERFEELNARLAEPVPDYCQGPNAEDPLGLGLYVVTRLAARHGVKVQLRAQKQGGVAAMVVLPTKILPAPPAGARTGPARGEPDTGAGPAGPGTSRPATGAGGRSLSAPSPRTRGARRAAALSEEREPVRPQHRPAAEEAIGRPGDRWHPGDPAADDRTQDGPEGPGATGRPGGDEREPGHRDPDFPPDHEVTVAPGTDPMVAAAERTIQLAAMRGELRHTGPGRRTGTERTGDGAGAQERPGAATPAGTGGPDEDTTPAYDERPAGYGERPDASATPDRDHDARPTAGAHGGHDAPSFPGDRPFRDGESPAAAHADRDARADRDTHADRDARPGRAAGDEGPGRNAPGAFPAHGRHAARPEHAADRTPPAQDGDGRPGRDDRRTPATGDTPPAVAGPGAVPESAAPVAGVAWGAPEVPGVPPADDVPPAADRPGAPPVSGEPGRPPALPRRERRGTGSAGRAATPEAGPGARPSRGGTGAEPAPDGTPARGVAWRRPDPVAPGVHPEPPSPTAAPQPAGPTAPWGAPSGAGHGRPAVPADGAGPEADPSGRTAPPPLPTRSGRGRAARRAAGADDWPLGGGDRSTGATPEPAPGDPRDAGAPGADYPGRGRTAPDGTGPRRAPGAAGGPDREPTPPGGLPRRKAPAAPAAGPDAPAAPVRRLTDKGLPKRTPRTVARPAAAGRERARGVNAEELRRRLGGFQQGAREGRRDAEAEVRGGPAATAGRPGGTNAARGGFPPGPRTQGQAGPRHRPGPHTGPQDEAGTVEEARD
ncbi:nitrate- and nitrite sensing domain-containing protein [Streptomyces pactum]|uniref:nitrate- and nitrite sensing domain-containing protein n=1 Tax=Streptomyces pactum TaxID=68249 RepID=UPI0027DC07E8|nr:nitrate- and nitrite sensing domain-containing protein [Streptomyces pactum]